VPLVIARLRRTGADLLRETRVGQAAWLARDLVEGLVATATEPFQKGRVGGGVIMWHGVTPLHVDPLVESAHVPAKLFRAQIRYLKNRYRVVPLADLVERLEQGAPIPDDWAVLTFDDGYRNNLTCARQILREEGNLPMSVFVVTNFLGTETISWTTHVLMATLYGKYQRLRIPAAGGEWESVAAISRRERANLYWRLLPLLKGTEVEARSTRLEEFFAQFGSGELAEIRARFPSFDWLSWDEARELHGDGVDVGSHTCTHAYLRADLDGAAMRDEIFGSRQRIEAELGRAPDHFAYPNGTRADFCDQSEALIREAGYRCGITTVPGTVRERDNPFELRRLTNCVGTLPRFRMANARGGPRQESV
jgi:peptidoglycan/xylan/chitin deacetylase (PgdA/CDA1 family)